MSEELNLCDPRNSSAEQSEDGDSVSEDDQSDSATEDFAAADHEETEKRCESTSLVDNGKLAKETKLLSIDEDTAGRHLPGVDIPVASGGEHENSNSEDDDMQGLSERNKSLRPFRDVKCKQDSKKLHEGSDQREHAGSRTSSTIDSARIRAKVKKSLAHKQKQQQKRIRVKGEASAVTSKRRENMDNIKQSTTAGNFWE